MESSTGEIDHEARDALNRLLHQLSELASRSSNLEGSLRGKTQPVDTQSSINIPQQLESLQGRIESLARKLDGASPETHRILQQVGGAWLQSQLDQSASDDSRRSDLQPGHNPTLEENSCDTDEASRNCEKLGKR